jgi:hypothetical protein
MAHYGASRAAARPKKYERGGQSLIAWAARSIHHHRIVRTFFIFVVGVAGGWYLHTYLEPKPVPVPAAETAAATPASYANPLQKSAFDQRSHVIPPPPPPKTRAVSKPVVSSTPAVVLDPMKRYESQGGQTEVH